MAEHTEADAKKLGPGMLRKVGIGHGSCHDACGLIYPTQESPTGNGKPLLPPEEPCWALDLGHGQRGLFPTVAPCQLPRGHTCSQAPALPPRALHLEDAWCSSFPLSSWGGSCFLDPNLPCRDLPKPTLESGGVWSLSDHPVQLLKPPLHISGLGAPES